MLKKASVGLFVVAVLLLIGFFGWPYVSRIIFGATKGNYVESGAQRGELTTNETRGTDVVQVYVNGENFAICTYDQSLLSEIARIVELGRDLKRIPVVEVQYSEPTYFSAEWSRCKSETEDSAVGMMMSIELWGFSNRYDTVDMLRSQGLINDEDLPRE